jgi:hypothetical protein
VFDHGKPVHSNQGAFLANEGNKKAFVDYLISQLRVHGYVVHQAVNDADTLIVHTALQIAQNNVPVTVVANDTDILVLLVYHFQSPMADMYLHSEVTKRGGAKIELLSIRSVKNSIGNNTAQQLLAIHAISGCDTTSALYGQGKVSVMKKITRDKETLAMA